MFSCLATLCLTKKDISKLDIHLNRYVTYLQKFYKGTPRSFSLLVGGSLPGEAIFHRKQLSLFDMICRLEDTDPLKMHAKYILTTQNIKCKSWFNQIEKLCEIYVLPKCLTWLNSPPEKDYLKKLVKLKIIDYWQIKLREEALQLKSLKYFNPYYYSLNFPSKAYKAAGVNRYEVLKLNIQLLMLSGRYRTAKLCRFWTSNKAGFCQMGHPCFEYVDTIAHILVQCPSVL